MSMADRDGFIWYDGKLVPWRDATTHVLTHSLHYGLAVFEGVRAYKTAMGTAIFRLQEHTERLFNSRQDLMKIPFTPRAADGRAARGGARQQAGELLPAPARLLRLREDGRVAGGRRGARVDRGVAVGRVPGRGWPEEGHPREDLVVRAPPRERHHGARQGRDHLRQLDPRQPRGHAARLRRGPAARHRRLRGRRRRREHLHREGRARVHARAHHGAGRHHVALGAVDLRATSGIAVEKTRSRATTSTSPTRRSSPAPPRR